MSPQVITTNNMYFIGITTGQSAMMKLFPRWAPILGLANAQLVGIDLPLHANVERYRQTIQDIKESASARGALITSHKIDIWRAARDLFTSFDSHSSLCEEISCIAKQDSDLIGYARDPINSGLALAQFLPPRHWSQTSGQVMCLGVGGSGIAIIVHLLSKAERPRHILAVSRSQPGLEKLRLLAQRLAPDASIEYILNEDQRVNDRLLGKLPPASLVINATGMGKDRPGSPLTNEAVFPERAIAWELNYRGELAFLRQALAQKQERKLQVHDGWNYFLLSWADHIARIFHLSITDEQFTRMIEAAKDIAPR